MLSTWSETRRVLVALLILVLAGLATACDSVAGPRQTPAVEFDDQVLVEDAWTDNMGRENTRSPIRKHFEE